jgi:hypothetical protein
MSKQSDFSVKVPAPAHLEDAGKVRLGGWSPSLPVREPPATVADSGKVRIGGMAPAL